MTKRLFVRGGLRWFVLAAGIVWVHLSSGCALWVDSYRDELAGAPTVTTVSVQAAQRAREKAALRQRPYSPAATRVPAGRVTHAPLYFEDPFEKPDDGSNPFACRWEIMSTFCTVPAVFWPTSPVSLSVSCEPRRGG